MQTPIHINLCGRIIQITDNAWRKHLAYIETLHNYFKNEQARFEIINDIEIRVAELMQEKICKGSSYIIEQDVSNIITRMGTVAVFEELDNWDIPGCSFQLFSPGTHLKTIKPILKFN